MKTLCRFCLQQCSRKAEQKKINEIITDVTHILLINLNLDITQEPAICGECTERLQKSFEFKSTCFYTEEYIFPFIKSQNNMNTILDLKELYITNQNLTEIDLCNYKNVCRFCMDLLADKHFFMLTDAYQSVLQKCLPELNLLWVKDPVICYACHDSLYLYANLIDTCQQTEENINWYKQIKGTDMKGSVALKEVVKLVKGTTEEIDIKSKPIEMPHVEVPEPEAELEKIHYAVLMVKQETYSENGKIEHVARKRKKPYYYTEEDMKKRKFSCTSCTYRSENSEYLRAHQKRCHTELGKRHYCPICTYKTRSPGHLLRHLPTHNNKQPKKTIIYKKCPHCDYKGRFASTIKFHILNIHLAAEQSKTRKCSYCPFKTKWEKGLKDHMRKHDTKCEYKCKECPFETKYAESLKRHLRLHKDPSELKFLHCAQCDFKALQKGLLQLHIRRVHMKESEVEKFRCDQCDYSSFYKGDLKKHLPRHKKPFEIRMFKCDHCNYGSVYKKLVDKHALKVHKDK